MPEKKKTAIQLAIERQAKELEEERKTHPQSEGSKDFQEYFENWESHIKTGKFKRKTKKSKT